MYRLIYRSRHLWIKRQSRAFGCSSLRLSSLQSAFQLKLQFSVSLLIALLYSAACPDVALSQAAITLGVQEIYDDNIFLENDKRRPAPLVTNDAIERDLEDGRLSVALPKQEDGRPDDDMITNLFIAASTKVPQLEHYATTSLEGKVGFMIFAEESDESRLTLDGVVDLDASDHLVPDPFYANLRNALDSRSNSIAVAEGTSARSTETYTLTGSLGAKDEVIQNTTVDLGYTGGYLNDLGEILFSDTNDPRYDEQGADYHTHTGKLAVDYTVSPQLTVGAVGDAGVQLFLDTPNSGFGDTEGMEEDDELDRTNANASLTTTYKPTERLSFRGAAGIGYSSLHDDPRPREFTIIDADGNAETLIEQDDKDNQAFIFSAYLDYLFAQSSVFSLSAVQTLATERDGQRIITRAFSANVSTLITDRLTLEGGSTFVTFAGGDSLGDASDRWEASLALSYALRQNLALVAGYNYAKQSADEDELDPNVRYLADDYEVNRAFVALNFGLVGLPL